MFIFDTFINYDWVFCAPKFAYFNVNWANYEVKSRMTVFITVVLCYYYGRIRSHIKPHEQKLSSVT